jgi:hypothetical protein
MPVNFFVKVSEKTDELREAAFGASEEKSNLIAAYQIYCSV